MAAELLALLSRQRIPTLATRKGLLVLDFQNDFLSLNGRLPAFNFSSIVDKLEILVPAFREFGDVIWVRSEYQGTRQMNEGYGAGSVILKAKQEDEQDRGDRNHDSSPGPYKRARTHSSTEKRLKYDGEPAKDRASSSVDDKDDHDCAKPEDEDADPSLTSTSTRAPCCMPGSFGADYAPRVQQLIDENKDMQLTKSYYSCFASTSSFLHKLWSKFITELFICGSMSNTSVYATAMDAGKYGIKITLVEDCLGYRKEETHKDALQKLREVLDVEILSSDGVLEVLKNPPLPREANSADDSDYADHDNTDADVADENLARAEIIESLDADREDEDEHEAGNTTPYPRGNLRRSRSASPRRIELRWTKAGRRSLTEGTEDREAVSARVSTHRKAKGLQGRYAHDEQSLASDQNHMSKAPLQGDAQKQRQPFTSDYARHVRHAVREPSYLDGIVDKVKAGKSENVIGSASLAHARPTLTLPSAALNRTAIGEHRDDMSKVQRSHGSDRPRKAKPLLGHNKSTESDGSEILYDLLPPELALTIFDDLYQETDWSEMHHLTGKVPRMLCCQSSVLPDGSRPVYRHPSDKTLATQLFTPTVDRIRIAAEKIAGHPLNHVLIQLYRSRTDYISEHSDKTLDIVRGSSIVNVSFGAQRTMRLRTKRPSNSNAESGVTPRSAIKIPLPHNSAIKMSLETNAKYLHGINANKRPAGELSEAENAFTGQRMSLTFRSIGTFLDRDSILIWGQGATGKTLESARPVINGDEVESARLIAAFGAENQASTVEWEKWYGGGFDVLHLK